MLVALIPSIQGITVHAHVADALHNTLLYNTQRLHTTPLRIPAVCCCCDSGRGVAQQVPNSTHCMYSSVGTWYHLCAQRAILRIRALLG